jgi:hypothetical protein
MELAVVELDDPQRVREAVVRAKSRERLAAGVLGPTRVVVYKRDPEDGAAAEIQALLGGLDASTDLLAIGSAWIGGEHVPALGGHDLLRLAELELEQALQTGGGWQRLVLRSEASQPRTFA